MQEECRVELQGAGWGEGGRRERSNDGRRSKKKPPKCSRQGARARLAPRAVSRMVWNNSLSQKHTAASKRRLRRLGFHDLDPLDQAGAQPLHLAQNGVLVKDDLGLGSRFLACHVHWLCRESESDLPLSRTFGGGVPDAANDRRAVGREEEEESRGVESLRRCGMVSCAPR